MLKIHYLLQYIIIFYYLKNVKLKFSSEIKFDKWVSARILVHFMAKKWKSFSDF